MNLKKNSFQRNLVPENNFGIFHTGSDKEMKWIFGKILPIVLIVLMPSIEGCSYLGPNSLDTERRRYNDVMKKTNDEELLLNLVRMRYSDRPSFLSVASITSSLSMSSSASATKSITDNSIGLGISSVARSLTPSFSISESPTISYAPLQGNSYVRGFLTPISPKLLSLIGSSGWPVGMTLKLCVTRMNDIWNAPSASRAAPSLAPDFEQFEELFKNLNSMGNGVQLGYSVLEKKALPSIRFSPDALKTSAGKSVTRLLKLEPEQTEFALSANDWIEKKGVINIQTRSLMGVLYMLSHNIDVPQEHVNKGWVRKTLTADGKEFDWDRMLNGLFTVSVHSEKPSNSGIAVEYKDKWFSIAENDIKSKITITMLSQILAMQAGDSGVKAPVLTIPVQ